MDLDLGAHDGGQHRRHEPGTEGIVLSKFKHPTWKPRARHDLCRRLEDPKRRDTVQHISANATTGFYAHIRCEMSLQTWAWCSAGTSISTTVRLLLLVVMIYGVRVSIFLEPAWINLDPPCSRFRDRPLRESSRGAGQVSRHASRRGIRCAFKNFETLGIASQPPLRICRRSNTLHDSPRPTGTGRSISVPNVYFAFHYLCRSSLAPNRRRQLRVLSTLGCRVPNSISYLLRGWTWSASRHFPELLSARSPDVNAKCRSRGGDKVWRTQFLSEIL